MFIAVEGCVGAGKSTVAKGLAALRTSRVLLEDFESNPFLAAFYKDPVAHSVETEFTFLLSHFHQLKSHADTVSDYELIADFHLGKDLLFADLNLVDLRTRHLFGQLYELLGEQVPQPSLMICLSASTELLLERIYKRNRNPELKVDLGYYKALNEAYEVFFDQYCGRKIRVSMNEWDFLQSPDRYGDLSFLIDQKIGAQ